MTHHQQEQSLKLLKATLDILKQCNESGYVKDVMEVTAIWDEAECDGNCLMEEVEALVEELINQNKEDDTKRKSRRLIRKNVR